MTESNGADCGRGLDFVSVALVNWSRCNKGAWIMLTEAQNSTSKLVNVTSIDRSSGRIEFTAEDQNRHTMKVVVISTEQNGTTVTSAKVYDWGEDAPVYRS